HVIDAMNRLLASMAISIGRIVRQIVEIRDPQCHRAMNRLDERSVVRIQSGDLGIKYHVESSPSRIPKNTACALQATAANSLGSLEGFEYELVHERHHRADEDEVAAVLACSSPFLPVSPTTANPLAEQDRRDSSS